MRRKLSIAVSVGSFIAGLVALTGLAFAQDDGGRGALAIVVSGAKVSLQQALRVSEPQGQPISAKFEIEESGPQLSVYTRKEGKFFEIIVDHMAGTTAKVEPITEGDDLAQAKEQSAALDKAKMPLREAVDKVLQQEQQGARAVSVTPSLKGGRPVAAIAILVDDRHITRTSQPLD
ncbi:hypothetical protein [Bradyrhizobium sp. ARR65]|uniref:hypothetical protein n=1 Tax=Bradyrhizobium sp. ARR65 TaxID=1040989 RepID=UPI000B00B716|nr:hypothetical protein [Bradyrhizobium sp. ARR65]